MQSVLEAKETLAADTPTLFLSVRLSNGTPLFWSTRTVNWNGTQYQARLLKHNLFEAQLAADTGIGGVPRFSVELANADSVLSQIERQTGFKGASMSVRVAFIEATTNTATTDSYVVFRGIANSPELIGEGILRLSAINRMTMQRAMVPEVRVQRMCPWRFPSTSQQRVEAVDGGARGRYSPFFRCGYSPDQPNGAGNLNGALVYSSCSNTRSDCEQRGMFVSDSNGRQTGRFGGFEFVPSSVLVRGNGQSSYQLSAVQDNQARYNDFVPLVYGTQWHAPDIVFTRNDGNLTRMEVLLGMGEIQGVLNVVVDGIEIPRGQPGHDMTSTGWYNVGSWGSRNGTQNSDFADALGNPLGDPYGSMAYLSVVVPNRVSAGTSLPQVQVLVQGLKLYRFSPSGSYLDETFTDNPAWVLLDVLMRSGWTLDELDTASFAQAAAYADELIAVVDPAGGAVQLPRFRCNFALKSARSAGEVIRSIRNSSRIYLVQNALGLISARVENTFASQQPTKGPGSNATATFNNGWPAYEFDESCIARKRDGSSSVVLSTKGAQDSPNRLSIEFQDSLNQYQQDSLSLADGDDADLCGFEVAAVLDAVGVSTFNQASRILLLALNRNIEGNRYITFDTSVKCLGLMPGDLITVTYLREGLARVPFRITKITPGQNFRTATVTAQIHDDAWYSDSTNVLAGALGRQPGVGGGLPNPVMGTALDAAGNLQYGITETESTGTDGNSNILLAVSFTSPSSSVGSLPAPLVAFTASISTTGGNLPGARVFYYAVAAVDSAGLEGARSFVIQAATPAQSSTNSISLEPIQLPPGTASFHVYRGADPRLLLRIASNVVPERAFTDTGLSPRAVVLPDAQFDHVNAYWRWELLPPCSATGQTPTSVSHAGLQLVANSYAGSTVRIFDGTGAGQEKLITGNSSDTFFLDSPWKAQPDATSVFVVGETAWRFGATGNTSPVAIQVPERIGIGVQVLLRAANASNTESSIDISPISRWTLGQSGSLLSDHAVPPAPLFGVSLPGRRPGSLQLSGIGFPSPANTRGIIGGTYKLHYFDELDGVATALVNAVGPADTTLSLTSAVNAGTYVQLGKEVLRVTSTNPDGSVSVQRAVHGTQADTYPQSTPCYVLSEYDLVVPFVRGFFFTTAANSWTYPVDMPAIRLTSAELFMTNLFGDGATNAQAFTQLGQAGLRTLGGGQFVFQVNGFLAVQANAAPAIVVDRARCVGSVFALINTCPSGDAVQVQINRNGSPYCLLQVNGGDTTSQVISGFGLPGLRPGDQLTLDILTVGTTLPGSDLTVVLSL